MKKRSDAVWLHVSFDLPTLTAAQRRAANRFRKDLNRMGFWRSQLSIYVKYHPRASYVAGDMAAVKNMVPCGGLVCILTLTDHQWSQAVRFSSDEDDPGPETPEQLEIF